MYFQLLKKYIFGMLSLETLFQTLKQMSQTSRKKFGVNPYSGYDFEHHNKIKIAVFTPGILRALIYASEGVNAFFFPAI